MGSSIPPMRDKLWQMKTNFKHMKNFIYILFLLLVLTRCDTIDLVEDENLPVATPVDFYSTMEMEILQEINLYRNNKGLPSFEMNKIIYNEALKHTEYMIEKGIISHDNFTDRASRLMKNPGGSSAAENVAYGYIDAKAVVSGWINSDGHRNNIEGNYNLTGIAAVSDKNGSYYFTQIFLYKP